MINATSPLPSINQGNIIIDASNAGVILDGRNTPADTQGFFISSNNNAVKGLQILRFPGAGIRLKNADSNVIGGNRSSGSGPLGEGNLLSGNGAGIMLFNAADNILIGNFIGTDVTGTLAFGNGFGIFLWGGSRHNRIGSTSTFEGNLVSGNQGMGIGLLGDLVTANTIIGNSVGPDVSDAKAVGYASIGIFLRVRCP